MRKSASATTRLPKSELVLFEGIETMKGGLKRHGNPFLDDELNNPDSYAKCAVTFKAVLQEWIRLAVQPAMSPDPATSYAMKHDFEDATGLYVTNGVFKGAMQAAGYHPTHTAGPNWRFNSRPVAGFRRVIGSNAGYVLPAPFPADARLAELVALAKEESITPVADIVSDLPR